MESVGLGDVDESEQQLQKVDFIALNTQSVDCFPIGPQLMREITAVYLQYDSNSDGVMQVEEISEVMTRLEIEEPVEQVNQEMLFEDFQEFLVVNAVLIDEPKDLTSIVNLSSLKPPDVDINGEIILDNEDDVIQEDDDDFDLLTIIMMIIAGSLLFVVCGLAACMFKLTTMNDRLEEEIATVEAK